MLCSLSPWISFMRKPSGFSVTLQFETVALRRMSPEHLVYTKTLSFLSLPARSWSCIYHQKGRDHLPHFHVSTFWFHNRHGCSLRAGVRLYFINSSVTSTVSCIYSSLCFWTHIEKVPEGINLTEQRASATSTLGKPSCRTAGKHKRKAKSHTASWVWETPISEMLFTFLNFPILLASSKKFTACMTLWGSLKLHSQHLKEDKIFKDCPWVVNSLPETTLAQRKSSVPRPGYNVRKPKKRTQSN